MWFVKKIKGTWQTSLFLSPFTLERYKLEWRLLRFLIISCTKGSGNMEVIVWVREMGHVHTHFPITHHLLFMQVCVYFKCPNALLPFIGLCELGMGELMDILKVSMIRIGRNSTEYHLNIWSILISKSSVRNPKGCAPSANLLSLSFSPSFASRDFPEASSWLLWETIC